MARPACKITEAELAVLQLLWEMPQATIRQLTQKLYPSCSASHYATVQKLLERLERKSFVKRDRKPSVHQFCSRVCREELIARRLHMLARDLCGGSLAPLLLHLLRDQKLSPKQRREIIDQLKGG
jgi:predicted transcriptional regulator